MPAYPYHFFATALFFSTASAEAYAYKYTLADTHSYVYMGNFMSTVQLKILKTVKIVLFHENTIFKL